MLLSQLRGCNSFPPLSTLLLGLSVVLACHLGWFWGGGARKAAPSFDEDTAFESTWEEKKCISTPFTDSIVQNIHYSKHRKDQCKTQLFNTEFSKQGGNQIASKKWQIMSGRFYYHRKHFSFLCFQMTFFFSQLKIWTFYHMKH